MIQADYENYIREYGAVLSLEDFAANVWQGPVGSRSKLPKVVEDWFRTQKGDQAQAIWQEIVAKRAQRETDLQQELFKQKKRLADAERTLQTKTTKKAQEDQRIATDKISKLVLDLNDLQRTEPKPRDARFFPGMYVPVVVQEGQQRLLKPMRYQCRLPGWQEFIERKYPGTYNARRDSIPKTWKELFGQRHGIIVVSAFYENVERHNMEHRELAPGEASENVVLEFQPKPQQDMIIACLWNESPTDAGPLLSFAAITDEPAPEVAAAGHDRTIIQIKPENVERWLTPEGRSWDELQAILDDRPEAYYEHQISKAA
ncbi:MULTISPECIES: SOS response-associated peptidase family protein [unclassified Pseudoxanthomonas]|uniref:SOS response-associated peptidase family protein n=1 Tax=unclassified Pseudoxanthomonas TaxID=2645906 RepID=UPI00307D2A45